MSVFLPALSYLPFCTLLHFFILSSSLGVIFRLLGVIKSKSVAHLLQRNELFIKSIFINPVIYISIYKISVLYIFVTDIESHDFA